MQTDVIVVGAGPVGCVAALAHARRGARVTLLDPCADQGERFAGELLHPTALRLLEEAGVDHLPPAEGHAPVRGFAVLSPEASGPRVLSYEGRHGATFHFPELLGWMREVTAAHPLVRFLPRCRVTGVEGQRVTWTDRSGGTAVERAASAGRIVGADGRFSALRKAVAGEQEPVHLSAMAGLLLRGVELPHEGHGHVVLGRVGPALVYRIGPDLVRVCLDVPAPWRRATRRRELIWEAYRGVLPPSVGAAVHAELEAGRVSWAVNGVRPRTCYGRPGLALVGDAVGYCHPMTAIGMTLGFGDATCLARAADQDAYEAERRRTTEAPSLLSTALYEIFSLQNEATRACREAIFHLWRVDPALRRRTMAFLACEDTELRNLLAVGSRLVLHASARVAAQGARTGHWRSSLGVVGRIAGLVHWLVNESVPEPMRIPFVQRAATPFELLRREQVALLGHEAALEA